MLQTGDEAAKATGSPVLPPRSLFDLLPLDVLLLV